MAASTDSSEASELRKRTKDDKNDQVNIQICKVFFNKKKLA